MRFQEVVRVWDKPEQTTPRLYQEGVKGLDKGWNVGGKLDFWIGLA
jgi:hypothetical protein